MGDNGENYYDNGGLDDANFSYTCPHWAPVLGFAGISSAVVFASKFLLPR